MTFIKINFKKEDLGNMDIKEMTEIMGLCEKGKNIQMREKGKNEITDWKIVHSPAWDWANYDYRVFINNVNAYFYEYRLDNTWKMTEERMTDFDMDDFADQVNAAEFNIIQGLGEKSVEDRREIEEE